VRAYRLIGVWGGPGRRLGSALAQRPPFAGNAEKRRFFRMIKGCARGWDFRAAGDFGFQLAHSSAKTLVLGGVPSGPTLACNRPGRA
jgi:hypothetical protein